jgi:hypothetical protein
MGTTDVLLIITIVLLVAATEMNLSGGKNGRCKAQHPTYVPRPSGKSECYNPFAEIERKEEMFTSGVDHEDNEIDELVNHPRKRGVVPTIKQPQHTKNLWKAEKTDPGYDDHGRRHSHFSSDLLTPYRDQYELLGVKSSNRTVKPPQMGSSVFENFAIHQSSDRVDSDNPLENERNPTIQRMLV